MLYTYFKLFPIRQLDIWWSFWIRVVMRIKNIYELKDFGIFKRHFNPDAKDFGRYNLFYGWNGSGKSTLSCVFRSMENKALPNKFQASEFVVNIVDGDMAY